MTESRNVVQRKRSGPFLETLGPVSKICPLLTLAALLLLILGGAADQEPLMLAGAIALPVNILVWAAFGFASGAKARGSKKPVSWGLGALFGFLLAPLGAIIFFVLWNSKLGGERCGFCPSCSRRIGFEVPQCPYCGCPF
jgi:hypothetical protein